MKILFLGTAGGRSNVSQQLRASGGIYIELAGKRMYLDPGPGALVYSRKNKVPIEKLDAILLSHRHQDHTNDINTMIDAWSVGGKDIKGVLIGSVSAIDGYDNLEKSVLEYYIKQVSKVISMDVGDSTDIGRAHITATKTEHSDSKGIGFKIEAEGKIISYVSDGCYFEGLEDYHMGADILIVNNIFPRERNEGDEKVKYHMDTFGTLKLIEKIKPKVVILQHFGIKMVEVGPENEARWLSEKTGVKVIAAEDFKSYEF